VTEIVSIHKYNSLAEAIENNSYRQYPMQNKYLPQFGNIDKVTYENYPVNPVTHRRLYLDTSAGGGYACCEQATFYLYIDRVDSSFWIQDYQAGFGGKSVEWYGPFKLISQ